MTADELKQRGYCCGMGCKECPYVPRHQYGNTVLAKENMKFENIVLSELLDTDIPVEWDTDIASDGLILGHFNAPNGRTYIIELKQLHQSDVENFAEHYVKICRLNSVEPVQEVINEINNRNVWNVEFFDSRHESERNRPGNNTSKTGYDILGTGGAAAVLSAVVYGLMDITLDYPSIKVLAFSAQEPSRKSLYSRMVKQVAGKLGWSYQELTVRDEINWLLF